MLIDINQLTLKCGWLQTKLIADTPNLKTKLQELHMEHNR